MTGQKETSRGRTVQFVQYSNPDLTPPIVNQVRLLARAGWRVDMISRDYAQPPSVTYPDSAHVARLNGGGRSAAGEYLHFVRRVLRDADPAARVVVGHDLHGFVAARLLGWRRGIPVVYHCHDLSPAWDGATWGGRAVAMLERRYARSADLVVVPDAGRAEVVARALHLERPPLVVANGPLASIPRKGGGLAAALHRRGFTFGRVVLRQGRIAPGHALEATVRSMPLWGNQEWGFAIIGAADRTYLDELERMASSLGVAHRFAILPEVSYDEIHDFTADADLGLGLYEPVHVNNRYISTASNKIMEYMAAGVPVVVSDTPEMRRFIAEYRCGVTADEADPTAIARAVNRVLGCPAETREMGCAGREAFGQVFCYERQYAPVLARLEALADRECVSAGMIL